MNISTTPFPFHRLSWLLRIAGLMIALLCLAPSEAKAQTWMVSTDAYLKLGVMDKFGQLGGYSAKFIVTNETNGKAYILVKQVTGGQNGVDVIFPSEPSEPDYFRTESGEAARSLPGRYVWECQVSGKRVVSGKFILPETTNDVTVIEPPKK
jgi:hypothetical protein